MKINDIPPSDYNKLPIDEQMEILKDIPIGSYIHLTYNNSPTMKKDDNEYRIVGYKLVDDKHNEWVILELNKDIGIDLLNERSIHPTHVAKSKRSIRNDKLKELGI